MAEATDSRVEELRNRVIHLEDRLRYQDARLTGIQEISRALGSTLNLDRVLEVIMSKITELLNADRSSLFLLDEETGELWAKVAQGGDDEPPEEPQEFRLRVGDGLAGWVARTGRTLNIKDAYKDPRFRPDFDQRTGYRTTSMLCQPMRNYRRQIIGVVQVLNKQDGYFTVDDEALLGALCSQAAVTIENSKLYLSVVGKNMELRETQERLRRKMEELDVLFRIEETVSTALDLDAALEKVLARVLEAVPADSGGILIKDRKSNAFVFRACGASDEAKRLRLDPGQGVAGWCAATGASVMTNDAASGEATTTWITPDQDGLAVQSGICVPISTGKEVLGAIQLVNRRGRGLGGEEGFEQDDLKLLTLIAGQVAKAVQNQRARDEILNQNRLAAIGQMLSGVLHDFKTPMTIVSGYAQLMAHEDDPAERQEYYDSILRQFALLGHMTREILAFARGERNLLVRKVFLHKWVAEVSESLEAELSGRGIELIVDEQYRGEARFDDMKMKRVVFNLARNAREAMPNGGRFVFSVERDGDDVVFHFADTGSGIPSEIEDRLFESFVTSGKESGTGLGLAIVKKIVDEHGGSIDFTSVLGMGTTFTVRLPVDPDARKDGADGAPEQEASA